jgi:hypothetical protein
MGLMLSSVLVLLMGLMNPSTTEVPLMIRHLSRAFPSARNHLFL